MMDLLLATSGGESQSASGGYVDDVFSAYTYTGNGSTQTINNGIDLAGKGGLVWTKVRNVNSSGIITGSHTLFDSARSLNRSLQTNTTGAQTGVDVFGALTASSTGYSISVPSALLNGNTADFVSWTFRKAPKFFDVVTYTGNNNTNLVSHSLGVMPGMIIVKRTDSNGSWFVTHRRANNGSNDWGYQLLLDSTTSIANVGWLAPTENIFHVTDGNNISGATYVAYLFAHDPSAEGIIQCGSFTTDGSGNATVNLGWEPQFSMVKASSTTSDWTMLDSMRGWNMSANDATLLANTSGAETVATERGNPTATGFDFKGGAASQTHIYLAIRRSNKPPTTGTQVYNAIARTGTGAAATVTGVGFAPDLVSVQKRIGTAQAFWQDRLRGAKQTIYPSSTTAESTDSEDLIAFLMDGFTLGAGSASNNSGDTYINHFFRRAKGFFDVVCYTGTGVARTVNHGLGTVPELMIVKSRNASESYWSVYAASVGSDKFLGLNVIDSAATVPSVWNNVPPTDSGFSVGTIGSVNRLDKTYVAYLFASLAGISKVGSYTGNGTSQTINCGFSTGARFILIKRTDATGDWYVWDSVRGIVAANDPHLSLNTTAAEVTTDDSVDPTSVGFIVSQNAATNINVLNAQYIYFCVA